MINICDWHYAEERLEIRKSFQNSVLELESLNSNRGITDAYEARQTE
jgi:hypothetical protein